MGTLNRRISLVPFCLVCGVDSGPVRNFMFLFIGGLVFASISILIWATVTGRFRDEGKASLALKAEEKKE